MGWNSERQKTGWHWSRVVETVVESTGAPMLFGGSADTLKSPSVRNVRRCGSASACARRRSQWSRTAARSLGVKSYSCERWIS
eukprot:5928153-Pyramimonas_sp.AAC.1